MKNQIATTKEQSQRLIACGVNPDTADMCYVGGWSEVCAIPFSKCNKEDNPAWSLSALLSLLPKVIEGAQYETYYFNLAQEFPQADKYGVSYKPCWFAGEELIAKHDTCPIEACVQMIEWLTQNGYKLNKP